MKSKRLIILAVLALALLACTISIVPNLRGRAEWRRTVAALRSLPADRVEAAVQAFARDRKAGSDAVPLRELVSGGYLRTEDIRGLEDKDVTVSSVASQTTPQAVRIRVRASDGSDIVLMADGSIQEVARP